MIQVLSKLKNYSLRWLFKPLWLAKFDSFWIRVCAIVAFSRIPGSNFTSFSEFSFRQNFLNDSVTNFSLPSSQSFPPFYSVILEFQENYWFPCFAPWVLEYVLWPSPRRFSFPILHSFLPFSFVSLKFHGWLPISEYAEVTFFTVQLLAVLLLYIFSQIGGIPLCRFESLSLLLPFFILFHSGSPRWYPLALWEVAPSFFLLFLARSLDTWEGRALSSLFLCSFLSFSFELS